MFELWNIKLGKFYFGWFDGPVWGKDGRMIHIGRITIAWMK
jgi:hypothetical protein